MIWTKPIQTENTLQFLPTEPNIITKKTSKTPRCNLKSVFCYCNSKWLRTSTLGMLIYLFSVCLNYIIGYTMYYTLKLGWDQPIHSNVRIYGDLVTSAWFALVFIALPWHAWEDLTCINHSKTRRCFSRCFNSKEEKMGKKMGKLPERSYCMGWICYISWMMGTWISLFAYGHMRNIEVFQTSLNTPNMTVAQKSVYVVIFSVVVAIIVYWCCKLCPCKSVHKCCNDKSQDLGEDVSNGIINEIDVENIQKKQENYAKRKIVFVRLFFFTTLIFVFSWVICNSEQCDYHLHHWWFGVVLILLSTATLDNWFDYFLQGVFWTFLLESIFNYTIIFGHFFI